MLFGPIQWGGTPVGTATGPAGKNKKENEFREEFKFRTNLENLENEFRRPFPPAACPRLLLTPLVRAALEPLSISRWRVKSGSAAEIRDQGDEEWAAQA